MKSLTKKIFVGLMAGSLFFAGASEVYAAEKNPSPPNQQHMQNRVNDWAKYTAEWSSASEKDILDAVKNRKSFEDIETAAMLSKISKKSFKEVLAMKNDWSDVMKKFGITHEKYEATIEELHIKKLAEDAEVDEAVIKNLLGKNYQPRDIVIAGKIAKASEKNIQEVLDMKKLNQRWVDVAKELKVDGHDVEQKENEEMPEPPQE